MLFTMVFYGNKHRPHPLLADYSVWQVDIHWMWMNQVGFSSYRDQYNPLDCRKPKVFRKNSSMAVLGSSPFLGYQMLSNECLFLKTRAPYLAQVHDQFWRVKTPLPGACHREGTTSMDVLVHVACHQPGAVEPLPFILPFVRIVLMDCKLSCIVFTIVTFENNRKCQSRGNNQSFAFKIYLKPYLKKGRHELLLNVLIIFVIMQKMKNIVIVILKCQR